MEHSTERGQLAAAQPRQAPGEMLRNSPAARGPRRRRGPLLPVARSPRPGRRSSTPAMLPHAGHRHRRLARARSSSAPRLDGSERGQRAAASRADAAILFDYEAWWGAELDSHPCIASATRPGPRTHRALWRPGRRGRRRPPVRRPVAYRLVVVPTLYLVDRRRRRALAAAAEAGATVADHLLQRHRRRARPHPPRRLPRRVPRAAGRAHHRVLPPADRPVGAGGRLGADAVTADTWTEDLELAGAAAVATYVDGPAAGLPAVTRRRSGGHRVVRRHAPRPRGHRPSRRPPGRGVRGREAARRQPTSSRSFAGSAMTRLALRHQPRRALAPVAVHRVALVPVATSTATCRCPRAAWRSCGSPDARRPAPGPDPCRAEPGRDGARHRPRRVARRLRHDRAA